MVFYTQNTELNRHNIELNTHKVEFNMLITLI